MKQPIALQLEGISHDFQYMFTNKGVVKISEQLNDLNGKNFLEYTDETLNVAVDILKENLNFLYKNGQLTLEKFTTEPRRFLTIITEELKISNSIKIIKEWENNFGSKLLMINESVDVIIIESKVSESWDAIKLIIEDFWSDTWVGKGLSAIGRGAKSVAKTAGSATSYVWNWVKDKAAKAYDCLSSDWVACLMENFRRLSFSAIGIGALSAIELTGFGKVSTIVVYGSLLLWDIYKFLSGKYTSGEYAFKFEDMIYDILGLIFPALIKGVGRIFKSIGGFFGLGKAAATKGGIFAKIYRGIKKSFSFITNAIKSGAKWLGDKLGIKWLANFGSKAEVQMGKFVDEMDNGAKSVKGTMIKSGVKSFVVTSALCQFFGLNWNCQEKDIQKGIKDGDFTEEQVQQAIKDLENNQDINWNDAEYEL